MSHRLPSPAHRQRGAVLVFALIALLVLLIGGVVMVRSMQTTLFGAGNYGFKRDLVNQSERAVQAVYDAFDTGALKDPLTREKALVSGNYSAKLLPTNEQGIPNALLMKDADFGALASAADISVPNFGVTIRYVVDRMCLDEGPANEKLCSMAGERTGGKSGNEQISVSNSTSAGAAVTQMRPVYRISMRVRGPRGTESFFQSTFAQ
jgi:type IV pilus assembly protein PilX